jgi:hypothetical protein
MCAEAVGDSSMHQEIYIAKTAEGRKFIQRAFLEKNYVHVRLELADLEVPFSTKGFTELWETVSRPSL